MCDVKCTCDVCSASHDVLAEWYVKVLSSFHKEVLKPIAKLINLLHKKFEEIWCTYNKMLNPLGHIHVGTN